MKVIKPNELTLLSTSVPENDAPAWSASSTYSKGTTILYMHRLYKSLKDGNNGKKPTEHVDGTESWWQDTGASNAWKMFDEALSSQTTVTGDGEKKITFSVKFNDASGFALLNITGVHAIATVTEEGDTEPYWSKEYNLLNPVSDWWEWFFEDQAFEHDLTASGIPPTKRCVLKIVFTGSHLAGIGHFTHGKEREVGATLYGVSASLKSYSKKETDEFGNTRLVRRRNAKRTSGELYTHPRNADAVYGLLAELENVPALWIGDNRDTEKGGHQALTVFGWIEEFHEAFNGPNDTRISITIQGLA